MAAGKYNFVIEQGTTTNFYLQYKDVNGTPITLEEYSAQMQIRPNYADLTSDKYLTLSSSLDTDGSGIILSESGSMRIHISAEKTDAMKFDEALYDLEIYSGSYVSRLLEGKVKVKKSVTR